MWSAVASRWIPGAAASTLSADCVLALRMAGPSIERTRRYSFFAAAPLNCRATQLACSWALRKALASCRMSLVMAASTVRIVTLGKYPLTTRTGASVRARVANCIRSAFLDP